MNDNIYSPRQYSAAFEKTLIHKRKVSVPITVKPFAETGKIIVSCSDMECPDLECSSGQVAGQPCIYITPAEGDQPCEAVIDLHICMKIPLQIGATAVAGEPIFLSEPINEQLSEQFTKQSEEAVEPHPLYEVLSKRKNRDLCLGTSKGLLVKGAILEVSQQTVRLGNGLVLHPNNGNPSHFKTMELCLETIIFCY